MKLGEVDIDSPPNDHLGDYVELTDPYPTSRAAWARTTQTLPGEAHADPDEIRDSMGSYAAAPHKVGTQVRPVAPSLWYPMGRILTDGAQSMLLVDEDPQRTRTVVHNHALGPVWLAPTPTRSPGDGALYVPGYDPLTGVVHDREIRAWGRIYLFTLDGFTAGTSPIHVQVVTERWG